MVETVDSSEKIMKKTPVFALSHGGPTFMYEDAAMGGDKGAFQCTRRIGKYISEVVKPKFIIYVSAHWQSGSNNLIEVGVPTLNKAALQGPPVENNLIYDFYGFPKNMYDEKFHSMNDIPTAYQLVKDLNSYFRATDTLLHSSLAERGIDHGVWVPLKVAFPDKATDFWNTGIPVIQVSLTQDATDFDMHYKLGQALSTYRSDAVVIVSGMTVHNLRDLSLAPPGKSLPYVKKFNQLLREIMTDTHTENNHKLSKLKELLTDPQKRQLLYSAHPTLDHFVPFVVGLGAGEGESSACNVKELYNNEQGSLGWGIYQYDQN